MSSKLRIGLIDPDKALLEEGHELFADIYDEVKSMNASEIERFLGNDSMDAGIINKACYEILGRDAGSVPASSYVNKKNLKKYLRVSLKDNIKRRSSKIIDGHIDSKSMSDIIEKRAYIKKNIRENVRTPDLKDVVVSRCKSTTCLSPVRLVSSPGRRRKLSASNLDVVCIEKGKVAYRKERLSAKNAQKRHMLAELNKASAQGSKNRSMCDADLIASNAIYKQNVRRDVDIIN